MVHVPAPVKKVFDTFPLIKYGPLANTTPSNEEFINSQKFLFENTDEEVTDSSFILCVNNTIHVKSKEEIVKIIPSDPISLGYSLILCFKNKLKLPSLNQTKYSKSSIMKMSYYASPNGQLPMLIENDNEHRNVRSSSSLNHSLLTKSLSLDPKSILFNDLIETKFYDLWILCLLTENISNDIFNKLFMTSEEVKDFLPLNSLNSIQTLQQLPDWNNFKVRHHYLFEEGSTLINPITYINSTLTEKVTKLNLKVLSAYYNEELESFQKTLGLLIDYINSNDSEEANILKYKLVGFFISIDQTLDGSKLKSFVGKFPTFLEHSYSLIGSF